MKKKLAVLIALSMSIMLLLTACGGSSGSSNSYPQMNGLVSSDSIKDAGFDSAESWTSNEAKGEGENNQSGQKLIRTAWLEIETTSFDEAVSGLTTLMDDFNGYFESRVISNYNSGARSADLTIRVQAKDYTEFLSKAGTIGHLTRQEDTQEDISEAYYDTAGRLETQKIKLERLQTLLKDADRMEDIITIESAISETEQTIDYLSGTLRHYDGKVDYATVYISLEEVYRLSNIEEVPETFFDRFSSSFKSGLQDFADGLEDFAVYMAYAWLHWLIAIAIIFVVYKAIRRQIAKCNHSPQPPKRKKIRKGETSTTPTSNTQETSEHHDIDH